LKSSLAFYDETLPIINKPKHPKKKGENKEQNRRTHIQKDNRTTKEGEPQRELQVLKPPLVVRSISNREREGAPKRMLSLEKLSPMATTRLKIKIACAHYNVKDTLCL
jgi:hypothetical protein